MELGELPEGWTPTDALAVIKSVVWDGQENGPGSIRYSTRVTGSLNICEAIGMLRAAEADLLEQYKSSLGE